MPVLGIDPGLSRCGYGLVAVQDRRPRVFAAGVISTAPGAERAKRLAELQAEVRDLIRELRPEVVAMERLLFQRNVSTAMAVGQAVGVVMAEAASAGCLVYEYSPNEVKQAVTGFGSAGKHEVASMVRRLLLLPRDRVPPDVTDALAVALCHLSVRPLVAAAEAGPNLRVVRGANGNPNGEHAAAAPVVAAQRSVAT